MSEDLIVQGELAPTTLFGTNNPAEVVERMAEMARTLEQVVRSQNLVVKIGAGEHVKVEGWTFLGAMLGVFPIVEWTKPVLKDDEPFGWEARVIARTRMGEVVGSAEAECLRSEDAWSFTPPPNKWGKVPPARDDYALRSMAQTRAVSKALRLPLGFVMQLAGFNPTPAEEMPTVDMSDPDIPFGDALVPEHQPPMASRDQIVRLFAMAGEHGVDVQTTLRQIVREHTGQESTKNIPAGRVYEDICAAVEAAGASESETA